MSSGSSCASVWKHSVLSSCQGPCLSQHPLSSPYSWCLPGPHASAYQCPCLSQHLLSSPASRVYLVPMPHPTSVHAWVSTPCARPSLASRCLSGPVPPSEQLGSLALPLWRASGGSTAHSSWWSRADCSSWLLPSSPRIGRFQVSPGTWIEASSTFPSSLMRPHLPPTAETWFLFFYWVLLFLTHEFLLLFVY